MKKDTNTKKKTDTISENCISVNSALNTSVLPVKYGCLNCIKRIIGEIEAANIDNQKILFVLSLSNNLLIEVVINEPITAIAQLNKFIKFLLFILLYHKNSTNPPRHHQNHLGSDFSG
jgi:hypothetical protein